MRLLHAIHLFDLRTFDWCLRLKHRDPMVHVSRWVSATADGHFYLFIGLICLLSQSWQLAAVLTVGFVLERTLYFILKNNLKRNRPQQAIPGFRSVVEPSDQFSFPSGHTSAAFLFMGVVDAFFPFFGLLLLPWAISVGLSRIILGVHFPTDTVAGAVMGYAIAHVSLGLIL